jgi:hypothetical protein
MSFGDREVLAGEVLPQVNQLVRLTVGGSPRPNSEPVAVDVPSRVEDLSRGTSSRRRPSPPVLHVALPTYTGDVEAPGPGTWCMISWLAPTGVFELPTAFDGQGQVGPAVRAWRLIVTGPTCRAQRRRFVRISWVSPVRVRTGERAASGNTVDLGEGGVRCLLPPPPLDTGATVEIRLDCPFGPLTMDGSVLRAQPRATAAGSLAETVIAFADPDLHGDTVRRLVFEQQLRARRSGLE